MRSAAGHQQGYSLRMEQDTITADDAVEARDDELVDELLIEEISIDGMCGVY